MSPLLAHRVFGGGTGLDQAAKGKRDGRQVLQPEVGAIVDGCPSPKSTCHIPCSEAGPTRAAGGTHHASRSTQPSRAMLTTRSSCHRCADVHNGEKGAKIPLDTRRVEGWGNMSKFITRLLHFLSPFTVPPITVHRRPRKDPHIPTFGRRRGR